jgi:hypothetical protein
MAQIPSMRGANHPRRPIKFAKTAGNIAANGPRKWQNRGTKTGFARYPRSYAR